MISFALTRSSSTRACVAATQIQHPLRDGLKDLVCALVESGFRACSYYAKTLRQPRPFSVRKINLE
jgi:hypothetical protein